MESIVNCHQERIIFPSLQGQRALLATVDIGPPKLYNGGMRIPHLGSFHFLSTPPPQGVLLGMPQPLGILLQGVPPRIFKSFVILGLQTPRNITFVAETPLGFVLCRF